MCTVCVHVCVPYSHTCVVLFLPPILCVLQVSPPRVGEKHPASVLAEVVVDTRGMRGDVASGWDELKQHDVLFLLGGEEKGREEGRRENPVL